MSQNTDLDLWTQVAEGYWPELSVEELQGLSMQAALYWYQKENNALAKVYEQYLLLRTLKGVPMSGQTEPSKLEQFLRIHNGKQRTQ